MTTTTTTTTTIIKSFPDVLVDVIATETASVDVEKRREMMSAVSINFTISLFFSQLHSSHFVVIYQLFLFYKIKYYINRKLIRFQITNITLVGNV